MGTRNEEYKRGTDLVESIWNRAKELLGDRAREELLGENASNVFKLTSNEEGSFVIIERQGSTGVDFNFHDANENKLFIAKSYFDYLGDIKCITAFECEKKEKLLEYTKSFKNIEFNNIKLLYCNYRLNNIKKKAQEFLGINEEDFSFKDPCYICLKLQNTDILSVVVNDKYYMSSTAYDCYLGSYDHRFEYSIREKDICLYEKRNLCSVEKFNLEIRLDYERTLMVNKNGYDFEFYYKDFFGSRKIKISLNDMSGSTDYQTLKSVSVEKTSGAQKSPVLEINYDMSEKVKEPKEVSNIDIFNKPSDSQKRYYNVYTRGSKIETTLDYTNISFLLLHPEIRDFIVFILNEINEKYPNTNMIEKITKSKCFGVLLDYILKTRDEYPYDEKVDSIFNLKFNNNFGNTMCIVRRVNSILQSDIDNSEKEVMINNLCNGMTPSTIVQIEKCINYYNSRNKENKKLELKL